MYKKSQVTVFVILGIVIIAGAAIGLYVTQKEKLAEEEKEEIIIPAFDQQAIQDYI